MKTLLKNHGEKIQSISDERNNGDGIWIYLKNEFADFDFDPFSPTRQIHEQTEAKLLTRFAKNRVRKVTKSDMEKYTSL